LRNARFSNLALITITIASLSLSSLAMAKTVVVKHPAKQTAVRPIWISAYYAIWVQRAGVLTPQKIDYTAFSHLIQFHDVPADDGTLDAPGNITPEEASAVVEPAHAAGRKVLLCIGGGDTSVHFRADFADAIRPTFINNLVQRAVSRHYDGLDIDMEPLEDSDVPAYTTFIHELRLKMLQANPNLLLTCATSTEPALFASLQSQFDQVNVMTYDQAGLWQGWKTWHTSSLYDGGDRRLNMERPFPSVQEKIQQYVTAGVSPAKLGLGIAFYGYVWSGAEGPDESTQNVTLATIEYHKIMDDYNQPDRWHWDSAAHAPYLSITGPNPADHKFISFDDETVCKEKVQYARNKGLGGVIIFELGTGYRDSQPAGKKDALLQAVKKAWLNPETLQSAASPSITLAKKQAAG